MSFVCVLPRSISEADQNYLRAQQIYKTKRDEIQQRIKSQYDVSGEEFVATIQKKLKENMQAKIESPNTGNTVGYQTILNHLYNTVEKLAREKIEGSSSQINNDIEQIESIQSQAISQGKNAQEIAEKEIDDLVQKYANDLQLDSVIYKYLPEFVSGDNVKLSLAQVFGYAKSIFKNEITKRANGIEATRIFQRHPGIILGYIREDATADASKKAIKKFGMSSSSAQTVGAEKSKIDILLSLTGGASSIVSSGDLLGTILSSLDSMNQSFSVNGESILETNEFLGIQSKPWKLFLPTTNWNKNSVGSRAALLQDFLQSYNPAGADNQHSWHSGVLYLSTQLEEVIGANTVMYVTGDTIQWTDDIFTQMRANNKYFAFMMSSKNELTSHVQIADHYG